MNFRFKIRKPFARNAPVDPLDVRQVKRALNYLGYYTPPEDIGLSDTPDQEIFEAIARFQEDKDLPVTYAILPADETEEAVIRNLGQNPKGQYIWKTVGDGRVRKSHRPLNGEIRDWDDSPLPGEEDNCRCSALPVPKKPCEDEEKKVKEFQKRVKDLSRKLNDILLELNKLVEKRQDFILKAQKSLGAQFVAFLLTIPIDRIGIIGEMLQQYFDHILSEELEKAAERFVREAWTFDQKINYQKGQFRLVFNDLKQANKQREEAQKKLDECKEGQEKNGSAIQKL